MVDFAARTRRPESRHARLRAALAIDGAALTVAGHCMRSPRDGERVEMRAPGRLLPGDVVVSLAADGRLVAHRLIGWRPSRRGWLAVTMADHATAPDPPLPPAALLGRVAVPVPVGERWRAIGRFATWVLRRLSRR